MMNISLPEKIQTFVEAQATAGGFSTISDYICHLILQEQKRLVQQELAQQEQLESLLLEGLESGDPIEVTDEWWDRKRSQLIEQFQPPKA